MTMEPTQEQIDAIIAEANPEGIYKPCLATCEVVARLAYAAGAARRPKLPRATRPTRTDGIRALVILAEAVAALPDDAAGVS